MHAGLVGKSEKQLVLEGRNLKSPWLCTPFTAKLLGPLAADMMEADVSETFAMCSDPDTKSERWSQLKNPPCMESYEYDICLDASERKPLGMRLKPVPGGLLIWQLRSEGSIMLWNSENPSHAVKPGDIIVEVNGTHVATSMIECLQSLEPRNLRIRRYSSLLLEEYDEVHKDQQLCGNLADKSRWMAQRQNARCCEFDSDITSDCPYPDTEVHITMNNPQGLPFGALICSQAQGLLIIRPHQTGLLNTWNEEHQQDQIIAGDVVLEANGTSDHNQMLKELNSGTELTLKLRRANFFKLNSPYLVGKALSQLPHIPQSPDSPFKHHLQPSSYQQTQVEISDEEDSASSSSHCSIPSDEEESTVHMRLLPQQIQKKSPGSPVRRTL